LPLGIPGILNPLIPAACPGPGGITHGLGFISFLLGVGPGAGPGGGGTGRSSGSGLGGRIGFTSPSGTIIGAGLSLIGVILPPGFGGTYGSTGGGGMYGTSGCNGSGGAGLGSTCGGVGGGGTGVGVGSGVGDGAGAGAGIGLVVSACAIGL